MVFACAKAAMLTSRDGTLKKISCVLIPEYLDLSTAPSDMTALDGFPRSTVKSG